MRARTRQLVDAAHRALGAVHTVIGVTHDCVRLAGLEVVDMHVGRRPVVLPRDQQQLWLDMRDRYAGEVWSTSGLAKNRDPGL